jgi:hypothetical protein
MPQFAPTSLKEMLIESNPVIPWMNPNFQLLVLMNVIVLQHLIDWPRTFQYVQEVDHLSNKVKRKQTL